MEEEFTTISFTEDELEALEASVHIAWEGISDDSPYFEGIRSLIKKLASARFARRKSR